MPNVLIRNVTNPPNPSLLRRGAGGISALLHHRFSRVLMLFAILLAALPSSTVIAQSPSGTTMDPGIGVIVHTAKPYKKIIDAIEGRGGTVSIQY